MFSVIVDLIGIALIARWFRKEDRRRNREIKEGKRKPRREGKDVDPLYFKTHLMD